MNYHRLRVLQSPYSNGAKKTAKHPREEKTKKVNQKHAQTPPNSRLQIAKTDTKGRGSEWVRTLGVGGAEVLQRLVDAHQRRLVHRGSRALPLPPLPPHPVVLVVAARLALWLGCFLRCGARDLTGAAVLRPGGGGFGDAALSRCAEGKPRASRGGQAGERGSQRVWTDGHARQVGHGWSVRVRGRVTVWKRATCDSRVPGFQVCKAQAAQASHEPWIRI